ncbi:MAG TPA: type I phosphomannose isomerase catalytic subunit [Chthoniobacterales bacterium]|nr:type I phosphomannose isomerase catalytic subunit [Chthoniobacterales bacterium]
MTDLTTPIVFQPIFQERIWGGRKLEALFGKNIPASKRIGESWEIVDRPEAQSMVRDGPLAGRSLHDLWVNFREKVFGEVSDGPSRIGVPRFPLLIKLIDAREKLSLQVHPTEVVAESLGGEAKTEFWYVAAADPGAEIYAGLRENMARAQFEQALRSGTIAECVHSIPVKQGDAMFLPSGRFHSIGAGNVLIEIQQNSDTTYRVFDWNRVDDKGQPRSLHIEEALQCIDFDDVAPRLVEPEDDVLITHRLFVVEKWNVKSKREVAPRGQYAIVCCLTGSLRCGVANLTPGEFFLVPASMPDREIHPRGDGTSLLRVTKPV